MADDSDIKDKIENLYEKQNEQIEKLNELCITAARHEAVFEAHLKHDEKMYDQIASVNENLAGINERMSEYGHQLAIHISASVSLKEQNEMIRQELDMLRRETLARLQIAEEPVQWVKYTMQVVKWVISISAAIVTIASTIKIMWH